METYYDFAKVLEKIPGHIEALINDLFPAAKREGSEYRIGDFNGEKGRSLRISAKPGNPGVYHDHSSGDSGNVIALVANAKNLEYEDAGNWLAKYLGITPEERFAAKKRKPIPVIEKRGVGAIKGRALKYAEEQRGIPKEVLELYQVACTDDSVCFPHFDQEGRLTLLKYWSADDQKKVWSNKDPIHVLFGKKTVDPKKTGGRLIITEGQWDAMTWRACGVAAVSIPSGCENDEWIAEDWVWLNQFTEIYIDFDSDTAGREAEVRVKNRLGYERCRVLRYSHKDANEVLKLHGLEKCKEILLAALKEAVEAPIENVVNLDTIKQSVKDKLNRTNEQRGIPFFLPELKIEFRPHESTLWFGHTSHGKSTAIEQQICYQISLGIKTFVASFESNTTSLVASLLIQFTGNPDIGKSPDYDEAYELIKEHVIFYDSQKRASPKALVASMTLAHRQLGITSFVIDNAMTLEVDRQDNTAQANTADEFRVFVARFPVHLHIACHIRKSKEDGAVRPPSLFEVRGASEWGDMSFNAIAVFRDVAKAEKIAAMMDDGIPNAEIENFRRSCPDGKFFIRKQRLNGELNLCGFSFDKPTKRFYRIMEQLRAYYTPTEQGSEPDPEYQPPAGGDQPF